MNKLVCLGMLLAVGFLWEGCREYMVAPPMAGAATPAMADTLSKHGIIGGDTLSGLRNPEPAIPIPRREPDAAIGEGIVKERSEGTFSR